MNSNTLENFKLLCCNKQNSDFYLLEFLKSNTKSQSLKKFSDVEEKRLLKALFDCGRKEFAIFLATSWNYDYRLLLARYYLKNNNALEAENIESRPAWKPMHLQPVFAESKMYGGEICEAIFDQGLCLPSGTNLTEEQQDRVIAVIQSCSN